MLVALYEEPERPANSLDYVKKYMGTSPGGADTVELKSENAQLKKEIAELKEAVRVLEADGGDEAV